ncbi:MAG: lysine biosynthesis protein LysX, partial [Anaerolineae bacterium]
MRIGMLMSRIRVEEKLLVDAFAARHIAIEMLDDRELIFDIGNPEPFRAYDVILERCITHSRAISALELLNSWGIRTVNTFDVANVCGSKFSTTRAL